MSISSERNYPFLSLKSLLRKDNTFSFFVLGKARRLKTAFGEGWYLLGERIKKGTNEKHLKGLLKVSRTTIGSIGDANPEVKHLDDLEGMIIDFEWSENARTVLATAVREWGS